MSSSARGIYDRAVIWGVEWPTVVVWLLCWTFWLLLCWQWPSLNPLIFIILSALTAGWHTSFQHEAIHGHPTKSERINRLMASPGVALWLPFEDYRTSHLAHHVNENLTDPDSDPESFYIWEKQWAAMGGLRRIIMRACNSLLGRMTIGACLMLGKCLYGQGKLLLQGDARMWRVMVRHWLFSLPPLLVALFVFDVPLWLYLVGFQLGPAVCMSLRSFLEHEASENVGRRTAIVYDQLPFVPPTAWFTGFFSLLFLNNNLHAAHHLEPRLAWYQLPRFVHENSDEILTWNHANTRGGYGQIAAQFAVNAKEPVAHPYLRK